MPESIIDCKLKTIETQQVKGRDDCIRMMMRVGTSVPVSSLTGDADFEKAVTVLVFDELERYAAAYRGAFKEADEWKAIAHEIIDEIVATERNQFVHQITEKRRAMPKIGLQTIASIPSISSVLPALANTLNISDQLTADTLEMCYDSLFVFNVIVETFLERRNRKSAEEFNAANLKKVTHSGKERLSGQDLREFLAESVNLKAALISKYIDHNYYCSSIRSKIERHLPKNS